MIRNFFFGASLLAVANSVSVLEPLGASETWSEAFTEGRNCNSADGMGAPKCWKQGPCCVWAVGPPMKDGIGRDGTCDYVESKCGKPEAQRTDKTKYANLTEEQWNVTPFYEKKAAEKGITYR